MSSDRFVQVHDCYFDVFNEIPRMETIHYIIEQLPREIKLLAQKWGWSDTEVGDKVYNWIEENKEKLR